MIILYWYLVIGFILSSVNVYIDLTEDTEKIKNVKDLYEMVIAFILFTIFYGPLILLFALIDKK